MTDVSIYYEQLHSAADMLTTAASDLLVARSDLTGDDVGIENPAFRTDLRLEMHRRFVALYSTATNRATTADDIAASTRAIATNYSDLDVELTGKNQP